MELLKEVMDLDTNTAEAGAIPICEAISQAVKELKLMKNGKKITNKAVRDFIKKNASLVKVSALKALAAHKQYKTNKRSTVSFFAKDAYEKKMVKTIVQSMINSKQYKIHRQRYIPGGGRYYELLKIKSGH